MHAGPDIAVRIDGDAVRFALWRGQWVPFESVGGWVECGNQIRPENGLQNLTVGRAH